MTQTSWALGTISHYSPFRRPQPGLGWAGRKGFRPRHLRAGVRCAEGAGCPGQRTRPSPPPQKGLEPSEVFPRSPGASCLFGRMECFRVRGHPRCPPGDGWGHRVWLERWKLGKMDYPSHILGQGHRIAPADPGSPPVSVQCAREKIGNGGLALGRAAPLGAQGEEIGLTSGR